MYFKITMFWFMLNIFFMISAIPQGRGLNKNSSNNSNSLRQTKNEPSYLILKDVHGNTYKYIYPNDMDQFSKMSTLGNKNSSTVIHLPPGILKSENISCETGVDPVNHPHLRISSTTSEKPRTTNQKNVTNENKKPLLGSNNNISSILLKPIGEEQHEEENTAVSTKENELTEITAIKDRKTEKEEDGNGVVDETVVTPIYDDNYSNNMPILGKTNDGKYESPNEQQNLYKSCDTRNGLILLVENDIKLKLFLNSNGILGKSSLVNSGKNLTIKSKDESSPEDDEVVTNDFPISVDVGE